MFARREVVGGAGALAFAGSAQADVRPAGARLAALESRCGGRLGVYALDTRNGQHVGWRQDGRFALCSTFKVLAAGAILARIDRGEEQLERHIAYGPQDLLEYAPVTRARVGQGYMPLEELCAAAVELSDNTAANLMLQAIGGPVGLTQFIRRLGDRITHLDRNEPALNDVAPGETHDTTSPAAMVGNLRMLLHTPMLSPDSRERLMGWMVSGQTGANMIRAGVPFGWSVGDKTGRGPRGATNDVAILWPADRKPIFLAVYYGAPDASTVAEREAAIAEATNIVCDSLRRAGA